MSTAEIAALLQLVGAAGAGAVIGVIVGSLLLRGYLIPYLTEKAKTVATKEDLAEIKKITQELKGIEHRYAESIESTRLRHQLQVAALDRRLQAHQQAYGICRHLVAIAQGSKTEENMAALATFQTWWSENCLYLTTEAASALYSSYSYAPRFKSFEQTRRGTELNEVWEKIISAEGTVAREAGTMLSPATQQQSAGGDA